MNMMIDKLIGLDLFGQSISLNINHRRSYQTKVGGFSSLLVMLFFAMIALYNFVGFIEKEKVYYTQETQFSPNPDKIVMEKNNFMAAFSIEQKDYVSNPMFNISIEQKIYVRDSNGKLQKSSKILEVEPCTLEHFSILNSSSQFKDEFTQLSLNQWLCPQKNFEYQLSGTYTSSEFNFIRVSVKNCENTSDGYQNWKPKCASEEEKQNHLNTEGAFKLQIYQVNFVINPDQPQQYYQSYLDGEMYFTFLPNKLSRLANLYYRKYLFENDESLVTNYFEKFSKSDFDTKELVVRQNVDFRDLTELGQESDSDFAVVYLRRSQFTEFIKRKYMKIDEFFSFIGGIRQMLIQIVGFFIIFYNRKSLEYEMINQLYNFPKKLNNQVDTQNNDNSNHFKISDLLYYFEERKIKNRIQFVFSSFFSILYSKLFWHPQKKSIKRGLKQLKKDLDIKEILFILQQVNIIKELIFKRNQLEFFNLIPKPTLCDRKKKIVSRLQTMKKRGETNEKLFFDKWKLLKNQQNDIQLNEKIKISNTQLLDTLEEDLSEILNGIERNQQFSVHYPSLS